MPSWRDRFQRWWTGRPQQPREPIPPPQVPQTPQTVRAGGMVWEPIDQWNRNITKRGLWNHSFGTNPDVLQDKIAQQYFELGFLDRKVGGRTRKEYRRQFKEYMQNRYGINFDREFDWEAWRELYGDLE
jgi:hypothetical protein